MNSLLRWYVRNPLFKRVEILDESHLDAKGNIMQENLDKFKIVNAYINEFPQIIKCSICSCLGYVNKRIGSKLICKFLMGELCLLKRILTY